MLLLHLLPDAVNALCASLHVKLQSGLFQLLVYRRYELFYISVAAFLCLVEFRLYHVVGVVLKIFQAQVFQLAFQLIQSQFVCQRGIQIACLLAHLHLCLSVCGVPYLPHQVHPVGNHYQYHPHVLGKRQQQVSEVFALYHRILLIQFLYASESVNYGRYVFSEVLFYFLKRVVVFSHACI